VLLVDGDLRNPSIHRYLDLPSGPGLMDYLTSGYPIADSLGIRRACQSGGAPAKWHLTHVPPNPSSPRMLSLVRELKHFYPDRYVLFDLPPLLYATLWPSPFGGRHRFGSGVRQNPGKKSCTPWTCSKEFPVLGFVLNKSTPCRRLTVTIPNIMRIRVLKTPPLPGKNKLCTKTLRTERTPLTCRIPVISF
jgi:hypothetical protein